MKAGFSAVAAAALAGALATQAAAQTASPQELERVRRILRTTPLIDGHNDLPWAIREDHGEQLSTVDLPPDTRTEPPPLHTDIPRLRQGGVGAQFWSVYVPATLEGPAATKAVFEQIDMVHLIVGR